jgi:hypothetical protein
MIVNPNSGIVERFAARSMNNLAGLIEHLFPNLFVRPSTQFVKNSGGRDLIVIEIGTDKGYNAKTILDNLDIKKMYLIDPYMETGLQGSNKAYDMAKGRLHPYEDKIVFILKRSEDAVDYIPDGIDFLYIDGYHAKKQVALELALYYPKMKKGGIIAGHDYCAMHIDLTEAVVEFAQKKNLKLQGGSFDWWFNVP